jgi:hypothetical protein
MAFQAAEFGPLAAPNWLQDSAQGFNLAKAWALLSCPFRPRNLDLRPAPKGLQDSAQGFNPVSTLGTNTPKRRALKGRQTERPNKVEVGSNGQIVSTSELRALTFARQ